jgi:hypothetical protein
MICLHSKNYKAGNGHEQIHRAIKTGLKSTGEDEIPLLPAFGRRMNYRSTREGY